MPEELGRIIRGRFEEVWTLIADQGLIMVRYERVQVAGAERIVEFLEPLQVYGSDAPRPIKDELLGRVLFADAASEQRARKPASKIG